jgi:hypothetical protein
MADTSNTSRLSRVGDSNLANFGQLGGKYITSGDQNALDLSSENYRVVAIQSLDDLTTLNSETEAENNFPVLDTDTAIKSGIIIFGRWKKVKLGAGKAIVYYA